jgi:calcium/calmodulin-dependent protein kinase I
VKKIAWNKPLKKRVIESKVNNYIKMQMDSGDGSNCFSQWYEYLDLLGEGAFAKVVKARCLEDDSIVAVKVIPKKTFKSSELQRLDREANILASLQHPNVVKFNKVRSTDSKVLIEMEVVPGGPLRQIIKAITPENKRKVMKSIYSALDYIHSKNIVHRDLKPGFVKPIWYVENILLGDPNDPASIKLADFGLSQQQGQFLSGQCGTLIFMAPEQFYSKMYSKVFPHY